MISDEDPLVAARTLHWLKGGRALPYVDERLGYLTCIKDAAGIRRYRAIRARLETLV